MGEYLVRIAFLGFEVNTLVESNEVNEESIYETAKLNLKQQGFNCKQVFPKLSEIEIEER